MPANAQQLNQKNNYFHIYNEGRENKEIFVDQEDYDTFIKYLKEYIDEPIDPKTAKKSFTVQGKTYHGVPHLPKNFYGKVELVGYSLIPKRFHLILKQSEDKAVESFIRSLSTRYSIYFNKKYSRSGSLFDGPYKSIGVNAGKQLSLLLRYLHQMGGLSSIHKYINSGIPNWLSSDPAIKDYNDFLNNYSLNQEDVKLLDEVTFQHKNVEPVQLIANDPLKPDVPQVFANKSNSKSIKPHQRYPELLFASSLFVFLFVFGLKSVLTNNANATDNITDIGQVAGVSIDSLNEIYDNPKKIVAVIKTDDAFVKIYSDLDILSDIIGEAFNNDEYEIVAKNDEWYEIQLPFYQKGYVPAKYIVEKEIDIK